MTVNIHHDAAFLRNYFYTEAKKFKAIVLRQL